jgi:hypothetical protein
MRCCICEPTFAADWFRGLGIRWLGEISEWDQQISCFFLSRSSFYILPIQADLTFDMHHAITISCGVIAKYIKERAVKWAVSSPAMDAQVQALFLHLLQSIQSIRFSASESPRFLQPRNGRWTPCAQSARRQFYFMTTVCRFSPNIFNLLTSFFQS